MRIGLISDTHGLLRPQALDFLRGSDHIIHAGDITGPEILAPLAALAPLTVVRGNNDRGAWAAGLPHTATVELGGLAVYVIHDLKELPLALPARAVRVVVSGHSHKPASFEKDGVRYVNPGSAGKRRFTLPISAGELLIEHGQVTVRLVTFEP